MENPAEAEGRNPHSFSQVVFTDTPYSYPPSMPGITCCYTLTAAFQPNPRDWVGICKVGWSSTKDYHTFVWVEPSLDVVGKESANRQAYFKEYYLPKDEVEFYQFCYVNSTGNVRGASTPFCFRSPEEQSMEGSMDDDLLVITTQEQLEKGVQETSNLQKELDQIRKENKTLTNDLQKEQQEAASLKEKCRTLATQLQEVQLQLVSEREEANKSVRQSEFLQKDLLEVSEQSEKIIKSLEKEQRKSNKIELQLADAHAAIADIEGIVEDKEDMIMLLRHEKEGLHKENQSLNNDIDGLRRVYDEHHSVPPADLPSRQPETPPRPASASPTDNWQPQQDTPEVHVYNTIENAYSFPPGSAEDTEQEQMLVCRYCQESFPGITQHELEQHERSH